MWAYTPTAGPQVTAHVLGASCWSVLPSESSPNLVCGVCVFAGKLRGGLTCEASKGVGIWAGAGQRGCASTQGSRWSYWTDCGAMTVFVGSEASPGWTKGPCQVLEGSVNVCVLVNLESAVCAPS